MMSKGRFEGFTDAILAIIMTIMVLEIKTPKTPNLAGLRELALPLLAFFVSFFSLGNLWYSHHALFKDADIISYQSVLLNMLLLAWVALVPVVTAWVAEFPAAKMPERAFALVTLGWILILNLLIHSVHRDNPHATIVVRAFAWWSVLALLAVIVFPLPYSGLGVGTILMVRIPYIFLRREQRINRSN